MKLRIKGNSIRLRLSKTEVTTLTQDGYLQEQTIFAQATFVYVLKTGSATDILTASFAGSKLTVTMPEKMIKGWAGNEVVGFNNNDDNDQPQALSILIEKDFKCTDNVQEDQRDYYDNPEIIC